MQLYLILVMLTEAAAFRVVRAVHGSNGAEALRLLYRRYNPLTQGRLLARLNEVLQVDLGTDERAYMEQVVQWEQRVHEFETVSRETLPDVIKRAIITETSPPAIRTHLLVNAQTLTQYAAVRAAVEAFLAVGRKWGQESGAAPMGVDAVALKGIGRDGKGEGKNHRANSGKGKKQQGWQGQGQGT